MTPRLTIADRRATILLDAPERRNALGPAELRSLSEIVERIETDPAIEVALVRASGPTFCAGYDLDVLHAELSGAHESAARDDFARVVDALENLRVPTICVLEGGAYGGGTDVALACDLRVGTPHAAITIPAARFGLTFYYGGLRRYVERVGIDAAKRAFLVGDTLDAAAMLRIGFLHEVVAPDDIDRRVDDLATLILRNVPSALASLKRSLNGIAKQTADPAVIEDAFAESFRRAETIARVRSKRSTGGA